ncbi:MAG TPA: hypothetical protein VH186_19785 [Chloroflexia bacterium]|nr:hypothetical protein [Chloroflexia bacterium]
MFSRRSRSFDDSSLSTKITFTASKLTRLTDFLKVKRSKPVDRKQLLLKKLQDQRSKKVIFLSHCLLNENTRYAGGACKACFDSEITNLCAENKWGMVQMPCPEQQAWGGVLKRRLLLLYGTRTTFFYPLLKVALPFFLAYTRWVYRRQAKQTASQIKDYLATGFEVVGVVGVDGSPSCGVTKTLAINKVITSLASLDVNTVTVKKMNSVIRNCLVEGSGIYTQSLKQELKKRKLAMPLAGYDLVAELDGNPALIDLKPPVIKPPITGQTIITM